MSGTDLAELDREALIALMLELQAEIEALKRGGEPVEPLARRGGRVRGCHGWLRPGRSAGVTTAIVPVGPATVYSALASRCIAARHSMGVAMRRLRFRVRSLLIAVALVAVLLCIGQMRRRAIEYGARASAAGSAEQVWAVSAKTSEAGSSQLRGEARHEPDPREKLVVVARAEEYASHAAVCWVQAAYYTALRQKYERAASHPWESITPDPPRPR